MTLRVYVCPQCGRGYLYNASHPTIDARCIGDGSPLSLVGDTDMAIHTHDVTRAVLPPPVTTTDRAARSGAFREETT